MKIIIITKSYYPIQSPRAMRATELAQQFVKMGHEVTVYTVIGPDNLQDYAKKTGVHVRIINTRWILGTVPKSKMRGLLIKILSKLFGRAFEFPNIEFLRIVPRLLREEYGTDLLITNAFPYQIHFGASKAKQILGDRFPKTWISDCGDPYMGNDVSKPFFWFKRQELIWGDRTDYVTIPIHSAAPAYFSNVQQKIRVIPQGFDFSSIKICEGFKGNEIPHFAYTGTLFPGYRDLTSFLEYLCALHEDFRFFIYTKNPETIIPFKNRMKHKLVLNGYIPRQELLYQLSRMDFLINLTNQTTVQSPSKLIDYGLSQRPILDISTPFIEIEAFSSFMRGNYSNAHVIVDIQQYNIESIANRFLAIANEEER